jgi:hypothetical protein
LFHQYTFTLYGGNSHAKLITRRALGGQLFMDREVLRLLSAQPLQARNSSRRQGCSPVYSDSSHSHGRQNLDTTE